MTKKILFSIMLLSLPLLASAYDVEINGVWYSLNPEEQVAQVTFQHFRIGDRCEWFNGYRFASESNSNGDEWFIVPMDLWERMKTETFYVTVTGDNPSIKVQDGWWSNVWTGNSIVPGNEMLTDNGNGTWTLSVNLAGDPLLNTMDEKHLQFTGTGFTLEDIYFLDANAGDNSGKLFVWENGTGTFDLETVNIPEKFNYEGLEYVVNGIGNGAFRDCESLTSVKIPNSVVSIGSYAFSGCRGLNSITIPNSVTSIGNGALFDTGWYISQNDGLLYLDDILLGYKNTQPEGALTILQGTRVIADRTFYYCRGLTSVDIPNSVISIGDYAFAGCSGLTEVTIPNSVTCIGKEAFRDCNNIISVSIPSSLTAIGKDAFQNCYGLTSVSITDIGSWCEISFGSATSNPLCYGPNCKLFLNGEEVKDLVVPNSVTSIGDYVFIGCRGLNSITIPNSVTSIGKESFMGCSGLTSLSIPHSVTTIGSEAFRECSGLTSVTIPSSVTSIGYYAFLHCGNLTSLIVEKGNTKYDSRDDCNAIIETETNTLIAGCLNTVIPNSVTSIGDGAFSSRIGLSSIVVPNSVTSIGNAAFYGCSALTSVVIPNSVTTIGFQAFAWIWGLTSVTIGNSVTSIGNEAFYGCPNLVEVRSMIEEPFAINNYVFSTYNIPLYIPAGTKALYESTDGWKNFANIVEMADLKPINEGDNVNYGNDGDINGETDLTGTVVNNMYYSIGVDAGGYSAEEGCIVITKETSDEQMELLQGLGITDEELNQNFTGIIFKVPAGEGVVKVNAETTGNMTLKVKVGNAKTVEMELEGKLKMKFPYAVDDEALVYIFAGTTDENAVRGAAEEPASLKIYGIEWQQTRKKGDLNGDGNVDVGDIMAIINFMAAPSGEPGTFDLNGDGSVDVGDIMAIINIMAQ